MSLFKRLLILLLPALMLLPCPGRSATSDEYYQAGLSLYKQKDYAKAVQYLRAAVQTGPDNWEAYQVLGYAFYRSNDKVSALEAFDRSLQIHPDNPSLRTFTDDLRAKTIVKPAPNPEASQPSSGLPPATASPPAATKPAPAISPVWRKGKWTNFHAGFAYASLGDLKSGVDTVKHKLADRGATAKVGQTGFLLGGGGGYCFDPRNAFGMMIDAAFFGGYRDDMTSGTDLYSNSFKPTLAAIELKYLHIFPTGSSSLRLGVGPGLYITSLKVDQHYGDWLSVTGNMGGMGFGGSLDLDWGIRLGRRVMFDIYGKGRYASTTRIKGDFVDQDGIRREMGLIVDADGYVGTAFTEHIGTEGIRWAKVDYTGGDAGIGFTWMY